MNPSGPTDGVRLLSHRPSVLFKIERHGTAAGGELADAGMIISGPAWADHLRDALASLSLPERSSLFAVRLDDQLGIPLPAQTLLDRVRTDWFPKFLSQGLMTPVFQPIVDLTDGSVYGREALMRGRMGRGELRGGELVAAAEAHDALYSFDSRARTAALEVGLPMLPEGEVLFVNFDPRAVVDVNSSLRSTWPLVNKAGTPGNQIGLEIVNVERYSDTELLQELVEAHRAQGAVVAMDDMAAGTASLRVIEELKPDVVKLELGICKGIDENPARRQLVGGLVSVAHDLGCRVVAVGIERDSELEAIQELGIDYGQGFYLGQPHSEMLPVDARMVARALA